MPESFPENLRRFTPDGSALDRDALLFEAGRLSARPNRSWQALVATLVVAQVVTLVLLWPRASSESVSAETSTPSMPLEPAPYPPPQDSELLMLNRRLLNGKSDASAPSASIEGLVPSDPPLQVFAAPPSLLN
jgi:hypothetical protein